MSVLPKCPKCSSEFTYEDGDMLICRNAPTSGLNWQQRAPRNNALCVMRSAMYSEMETP